jgi:hypothetical protein
MKRMLLSWMLIWVWTLAISSGVQADWTSFTGAELSSTVAEVWIHPSHITLRLEIGDRDRHAFADLLDATSADEARGDTSPAGRLERFFRTGLVLAVDGGTPLVGDVKVSERRQRVSRPTPFQPAPGQDPGSAVVAYVEIVYPLLQRPDVLTLTPPLQADGEPAVDIGFIVYHQFIPVLDFQYLQSRETLRLDWTDPWYSAFENPILKRHHRAPLMTFLYIEPYEVRFEILMRLKELASWMAIDLPNDGRIEPHEQIRLQQRVGQFFLQRNPLRIDSEPRRPMLDRVQFVNVTQQGIQPLAAEEPLTFHTAILGVILAYATPGPPQKVTVTWELFNANITSVPISMIDPVSALPYDLTTEQPVLTWTNMLANYGYQVVSIDAIAVDDATRHMHLPLPSLLLGLVAILCVGGRIPGLEETRATHRLVAGMLLLVTAIVLWSSGRIAVPNPFASPYVLREKDARLILKNLLWNTYRALDFRREDDVYDKLAVSVTGELISDIYLQHRKRLELADQGGARARVQDVELLNLDPLGSSADDLKFTFQCTWLVAGSVGHWGHTHWRRNQYAGQITLKPIEKAWKIIDLNLTDERRLP